MLSVFGSGEGGMCYSVWSTVLLWGQKMSCRSQSFLPIQIVSLVSKHLHPGTVSPGHLSLSTRTLQEKATFLPLSFLSIRLHCYFFNSHPLTQLTLTEQLEWARFVPGAQCHRGICEDNDWHGPSEHKHANSRDKEQLTLVRRKLCLKLAFNSLWLSQMIQLPRSPAWAVSLPWGWAPRGRACFLPVKQAWEWCTFGADSNKLACV